MRTRSLSFTSSQVEWKMIFIVTLEFFVEHFIILLECIFNIIYRATKEIHSGIKLLSSLKRKDLSPENIIRFLNRKAEVLFKVELMNHHDINLHKKVKKKKMTIQKRIKKAVKIILFPIYILSIAGVELYHKEKKLLYIFTTKNST